MSDREGGHLVKCLWIYCPRTKLLALNHEEVGKVEIAVKKQLKMMPIGLK